MMTIMVITGHGEIDSTHLAPSLVVPLGIRRMLGSTPTTTCTSGSAIATESLRYQQLVRYQNLVHIRILRDLHMRLHQSELVPAVYQ